MARTAILSLVLLPGLLLTAKAAAPPASDGGRAADLVRELSAGSFDAREEAARRLLRLGPAAAPALKEGLKSRDLEVRRRCRELLPQVLAGDLDRRLAAFVADEASKDGLKLIGWATFHAVAGHDRQARQLYVELYRTDRALLDLLEQGPAQAGAQVTARAQRLQQSSFVRFGGVAPAPKVRSADVAGLLLAATCAQAMPQQTYYQFVNVFYSPSVRSHVQNDPALRRLTARAFLKHGTGPNTFYQTAYLARMLELTELNSALRPLVLAQVRAALTQPPDLNKLAQAVSLATNLGLEGEVAGRVKPVARQLARDVVEKPDNQGRIYQVMSLLQSLKMQDTIDEVLRPGALKLALAVAERPSDQAAFYRAFYLARSINAPEALAALKVAGRKMVIEAAARPADRNQLQQAIYVTQNLGLMEAREAILKPAVRKHVLAMLEQSDDLNQLTQAAHLAKSVDLAGLSRDTLKPLVKRRAADVLKGSPTLAQIQQVQNLAQQLGLNDVTDDAVKPALRKYLTASASQPIAAGSVYQVLALARALQLKEGVPFAARAANQKGLDGYSRSSAVLFVAAIGTREQMKELAPLVADATSLGQAHIGGSTCHTRLGDVVLGALLHVGGQSLGDYGFAYFQNGPGIGVLQAPPVFFGFASEAARDSAVAKWKKWEAGRKK